MELPLDIIADDIAFEILGEWGLEEGGLNRFVSIYDEELFVKKLKEHLDEIENKTSEETKEDD